MARFSSGEGLAGRRARQATRACGRPPRTYCDRQLMTEHHLEVRPRSRHDWLVSYEGDPTPLSEHATQTEAVAAARNWARQFGERVIHVHELDAEIRTVAV